MTKLKLLLTHLFWGAVLLAFFQNIVAQQITLATDRSGTPLFQSLSLAGSDRRKMFFNVGRIGSIKGRIFSDAQLADNADNEYGIGGVKVTLRSTDEAFADFVIVQYTNDVGAYYFGGLWPGRYSIEIDPADVPELFRTLPAKNTKGTKTDSEQDGVATDDHN